MQAVSSQAPRRDIHAEITDQLIAAIEADPGRPSMPWRRPSAPLFMPVNAFTGNAYNGINIVSLWVSAEVQGYSAPVWATYRQWSELGAQVRKGETSSLVIFYKEFDTEPRPDDADDDGSAVSPGRHTCSTPARSKASPAPAPRSLLVPSTASLLPITSSLRPEPRLSIAATVPSIVLRPITSGGSTTISSRQ